MLGDFAERLGSVWQSEIFSDTAVVLLARRLKCRRRQRRDIRAFRQMTVQRFNQMFVGVYEPLLVCLSNQSNVCLNIRSNAHLNNHLNNQSNNQSNVRLSIRSNNNLNKHSNKHSNAPSVNKPIHGNGVAGHGYQAGRTNAQCAHSIHPLIPQLKHGLHYD